MDIRKTALSILRDAEQKDKYIALTLGAALDGIACDERDRALLTNLVYGVTERRVTLDYYIEKLCDRPIDKVGARLAMTLRLGLYQLMYLDRIPPHAAVSETVRLGKSQGERAFLNGVLRGYLRQKGSIPLPEDPLSRMAVAYSFPRDTVALLCDNLGDKTEAVLASLSKHPPMTICVNTLHITVENALETLTSAGLDARRCTASPRGIRIYGNVSHDRLCELLGEQNFFVQDEASQIAISVLSPKAGEIGADACACPGSKSFHAALCMQNRGKIHAFDLHESKLPLIESGANLIVTVDTGITANAEVEHALSRGADVVVTDHHECHGDLPHAAAVVNPRRPDCDYPFKELAGVGVVFKLLCAFEAAYENISEYEAVRRICDNYADLVIHDSLGNVFSKL